MYVITQLTSIQILLIGIYSSDVRLPPTITKHPVESTVFRSDDETTLQCEASGSPQPQYEWFKNGKPLSNPENLYQIKEGVIRIRPLTALDEGYYQCKASNQYGVALSKMSCIRRAVLEHFTGSADIFESDLIEEGQPYSLRCNPAKVFPKPEFSWARAGATGPQETSQGVPVVLDRRVQIDEHGDLRFAYVTLADAPEDKVYKCNMYNRYMDITMGGSYSRLRVKQRRIKDFGPTIQFHSPSPAIALEGQNVTISCFFSGHPAPTVSWSRRDAASHSGKALLLTARYEFGNYHTKLTISKVEPSDEGEYYCSAKGRNESRSYTIDIDVQAAPVFREIHDQPHSRNVTEGNDVTIYCKAYAEPPAMVVWYRNGAQTNFNGLNKYHLSGDGQKLTIHNLCKDCPDSSSDLTVIQCNASNVHGYAFADGYINVLKKTSIIFKPEDVRVKEGVLTAQFDCMAKSDESTSVTIDWYRVSSTNDDTEDARIQNVSNRVYIGSDFSLFFFVDNYTDWIHYIGHYRCEAKNGYSIDSAEATLEAEDLRLPPPPPLATAGFGDLWWIFVIIAAILLLLIFLICCCICLQRNKGDTYPVDEKERKSGNNPEKELVEGGFHDYQRPEGEPLKGSRASLSSSIKIDSDEEASLNEYGDIDAGKFTEDGSFIGDYGVEKKRANANADHKV